MFSRSMHQMFCANVPFLLLIAILLSGVAEGATPDEEFIPDTPRNLRDLDKYYEFTSPADAARELRHDAERFGLDIHKHPTSDKSTPPFSVLHLPVADITPDFRDQSYVTLLRNMEASSDASNESIAILAVYRELSIDEIASMFESDIDILQRLYAGPNRRLLGGYIVKGSAESLVELQQQDYFAWLGEYSADLKRQADLGASSIDRYTITLYRRNIEESYYRDLEAHQVKVLGKSARFRRIRIGCTWEIAKALCSLNWVKSLYPNENPVHFGILGNGAVSDDTEKLQHTTALAQNARILAGSDGPGDGSNVVVGVVDGAIEVDHESLLNKGQYVWNYEEDRTHGTAVTSVIVGSEKDISCPFKERETFEGIAPGALYCFVTRMHVMLNDDQHPDLFFEVFDGEEVQVSNHSYGLPSNLYTYDVETELYDEAALGPKSAVIVAANGNLDDVTGIDSPVNPGLGKNVLAVGSVKYVDYYEPSGVTDEYVGQISPFSNRGATLNDGRLKPELVAPGGSVLTGSWVTPFYGVVVARSSDGTGYTEDWCDVGYCGAVGTSIASPMVVGGIAKVMDQLPGADYGDDHLPQYSSQLIRALMINSAIPLKGNAPELSENATDAMHRGYCNTTYGYGLTNPASAVYYGESNSGPDDSFERIVFQPTVTRGVGRTGSFSAGGSGSRTPVRIAATLVYNDTPGVGLNNDLNFSLASFGGLLIEPGLAPGVTCASPIKKIIIDSVEENDLDGNWNWYIDYPYAAGTSPYVKCAVVVDVYYDTPKMVIELDDSTIRSVEVGDQVTVSGIVKNTGGGVVAGASVRIPQVQTPEDPHLTGDLYESTYPVFLGNLYGGIEGEEAKSFSYTVTIAGPAGLNYLPIEANAANLEFKDQPATARAYFQIWDDVPTDKASWNEPKSLGAPSGWSSDSKALCSKSDGDFCVLYSGYGGGGSEAEMKLQEYSPGGQRYFESASGHLVTTHNIFVEYEEMLWDSSAGLILIALDHGIVPQEYSGTIKVMRIDPESGAAITGLAPIHDPPRRSRNTGDERNFFAGGVGNGAILLVYQKYTGTEVDGLYIERVEVVDTDGYDSSWEVFIPGVTVTGLEVLFDDANGVYISYHLESNPSPTQIVHVASDGVIWQNPIELQELTSPMISGPRGGVYVVDGATLHLINREGQYDWGESGRALDSDWLRLVASDGCGGFLVEKNTPDANYAIMRVGSNLLEIWENAAVVIPIDQEYGGMPMEIGDGWGGLIYSNEIIYDEPGRRDYAFVSVDGDGIARTDMSRYLEAGTIFDNPRNIRGIPDGYGGSIYAYDYVWYDQDHAQASVERAMRIGLSDGHEYYSVCGAVVNGAGVPVGNQVIRVLDGDTEEVLYTTSTDSKGRFEFSAVPGFSDIRVVPDTGYMSSPGFYAVELLKHDLEASFMIAVPAFEDVSISPLLGQNRVANAADWADYDCDGDDDLFLSYGYAAGEVPESHECDNKLIENSQHGLFTDVTPADALSGIAWNGPTISTAWADFDNDGDRDVYISNGVVASEASRNLLCENTGSPGGVVFTRFIGSDLSVYEDASAGGRVDWIDLDNDGDLELIAGRPGQGPLVLRNWFGNQGNDFEICQVSGLTDQIDSGFWSWGDYDSDGLIDVFVFGYFGSNRLMKNNGDWTFADVTSQMGLTTISDTYGKSAAWGDYDNDGDVDLFVSANGMAPYCNLLFRNDNEGFVDVTTEVGLSSITDDRKAIAWTDIDNDGDLDLVIAGEPIEIWTNQFPELVFELRAGYCVDPIKETRTMSLADYDSDGDEDLYVGIHSHGVADVPSRLYQNVVGEKANWLKINLQGTVANRDGIGAIIKVYTDDGVVQARQLTGSLGGSSHKSFTQIVGLGENTEAKKIRVSWPWGRQTEVPSVDAGSSIIVTDEFAASRYGELYLTTDSSGQRMGYSNPIPVGVGVSVYLAADMSSAPIGNAMLGGFETKIRNVGDNIDVFNEELLVSGVDSDQAENSFSVRLDQSVDLRHGPVPLVRFLVFTTEEGYDPSLVLDNVDSPSFIDPIESPVQCWWDWDSDILYRFKSQDDCDGSLLVPLNDTKAPEPIHAGLWLNMRNWVVVVFDEPISLVATDGSSSYDASHFLVYVHNGDGTNSEIDVTTAMPYTSTSKEFLMLLEAEIPDEHSSSIRIQDLQDPHNNAMGTRYPSVTSVDIPPGEEDVRLNEIRSGDGDKSGSMNIEWLELANENEASVCFSGWRVEDRDGHYFEIPENPIVIAQPGEYVVLVGDEDVAADFGDSVVSIVCEGSLHLATDAISVKSAFGIATDVLDLGVFDGKAIDATCSFQRIYNSETDTYEWIADAPEYADGLRGTPGTENRTESGNLEADQLPVPVATGIMSIVPNPFNPKTTVTLSIKDAGPATVKIYDIRGRNVATLLDEYVGPTAELPLVWNGVDGYGRQVSSGVYFVRLVAPGGVAVTSKIVLLK